MQPTMSVFQNIFLCVTYIIELSGYSVLYSFTSTLQQTLIFGSGITEFKYEKIEGMTEIDTIMEQIVILLFLVYIFS